MVGRFLVRQRGHQTTGLAAHAVEELLNAPDHGADGVVSAATDRGAVEIYLIHRVDDAGRFELRGLRAAQLRIPGALLIRSETIVAARAIYDAIADYAETHSPPCRIELQLAHLNTSETPHATALMFPDICTGGVAAWLDGGALVGSAPYETGRDVLVEYEAARRQIVRQITLDTPASM